MARYEIFFSVVFSVFMIIWAAFTVLLWAYELTGVDPLTGIDRMGYKELEMRVAEIIPPIPPSPGLTLLGAGPAYKLVAGQLTLEIQKPFFSEPPAVGDCVKVWVKEKEFSRGLWFGDHREISRCV